VKRLREGHATEADALAAAQAEWQRVQRGAATFELTLALGVPELGPRTPVRVRGSTEKDIKARWQETAAANTLTMGR